MIRIKSAEFFEFVEVALVLDAAEILDVCPLFARVAGPSRARLHAMSRLAKFERGEQIFRQDDPCPGVYVVGSGLVRIYKLAASGKEHVLHLAAPRMTFLEAAAILGVPCPAYAQAIEESACALLPLEPFSRALAEDHMLCRQLLGGMALRVRNLVELLEDIVLRDALSRVAKYLLSVAADQGMSVNLPALKKHLASHLNLTSETLSRCLRQLTDAGLIAPEEGQALRIVDLAQLKEAAEGLFPVI